MAILGLSGSAQFGPLPHNRIRRYTVTIEATFRDETRIIERRFRSGTYKVEKKESALIWGIAIKFD